MNRCLPSRNRCTTSATQIRIQRRRNSKKPSHGASNRSIPGNICSNPFAMLISRSAFTIAAGLFVLLIIGQKWEAGWGQVTGEEAELNRLEAKAEDAISNDDPDAAALNMGRAALLAKQLGKKHRDEAALAALYQGAEPLFRSQEHGYRAMALFRRAGGQLPASSGVCGSLALAQGSVQQALALLTPVADDQLPDKLKEQSKRFRQNADDWTVVVASMITDYQCP